MVSLVLTTSSMYITGLSFLQKDLNTCEGSPRSTQPDFKMAVIASIVNQHKNSYPSSTHKRFQVVLGVAMLSVPRVLQRIITVQSVPVIGQPI